MQCPVSSTRRSHGKHDQSFVMDPLLAGNPLTNTARSQAIIKQTASYNIHYSSLRHAVNFIITMLRHKRWLGPRMSGERWLSGAKTVLNLEREKDIGPWCACAWLVIARCTTTFIFLFSCYSQCQNLTAKQLQQAAAAPVNADFHSWHSKTRLGSWVGAACQTDESPGWLLSVRTKHNKWQQSAIFGTHSAKAFAASKIALSCSAKQQLHAHIKIDH